MSDQHLQEWHADIRKEIRFAVVLYGGVSLAVYISGVVRELLAMVRATAPGKNRAMFERESKGSISVYRQLAADLNAPENPQPGTVYTRFVVDVISGTSAGGLNGIYLGKALAEGMTLDGIRAFWMQKGDIVGLLDAENESPRSVLSGDIMLRWLYEAFDSMTPIPESTRQGGLVDDVTVYATTTDLSGLPIFLRHSNATVVEHRYKNVYHFAFSSGAWGRPKNDFNGNDNALSFAARCTSSFPAAFAPARVLDLSTQKLAISDDRVRKLFPDYTLPPDSEDVAFAPFDPAKHAFADGGILNNKPFGHALNALATRRGGKPSERKLIYVEPSPKPSPLPTQGATHDFSKPDFMSVIAKAFSLPREQTIREELRRIDDRNRLIDRMNGILADVPQEVRMYNAVVVANLKLRLHSRVGDEREVLGRLLTIADPAGGHGPKSASECFVASDVQDMVEIFGLGYAGYHRIKVASVTDDVTNLVARLLSMPEESDDWRAVRILVRTWRDINFAPYLRNHVTASEEARRKHLAGLLPQDAQLARNRFEAPLSENAFLVGFDLRFGVRRLDFLLNKIDDLFCMDERAVTLLRSFGVDADKDHPWMNPERREELARLANGLGAVYMMLRDRLDSLGETDALAKPFSFESWQNKLTQITRRDASTVVSAPVVTPGSGLAALVAGLGIDAGMRQELLLLAPPDQEREAVRIVAHGFAAFEAAADELSRLVKEASVVARHWITTAILPQSRGDAVLEEPGDIIRFLFDHYEAIDRITFPVFYQTDVGQETDVVSLVRISPDDAGSITGAKSGSATPKLGGETLGHFGGFFSSQWRATDFLWGQLDAAELLIKAVTEGSNISAADVADRIATAQVAILESDSFRGIQELEDLPTGAERLAYLRSNWRKLTEPPKDMDITVSNSLSGGLPILSRILRSRASGLPGILGRLGSALVQLARSTFDTRLMIVVFAGVAILALAGGASFYSGLTDFLARASWTGGRVPHYLSVIGRTLGGALLVGFAGVIGFLWVTLRKAIDTVRAAGG